MHSTRTPAPGTAPLRPAPAGRCHVELTRWDRPDVGTTPKVSATPRSFAAGAAAAQEFLPLVEGMVVLDTLTAMGGASG
jgi:hypothetical protein